MIDLIYRSKVPGYKGAASTTQGRTGLLSGLWCYLFGAGTVPLYRTKGTSGGATAPTAPRCWWSLSGSPQYKAPPVPRGTEPESEAVPPEGEDCGCEPQVVPREIHVYPAE
jgi:hypothetical protein